MAKIAWLLGLCCQVAWAQVLYYQQPMMVPARPPLAKRAPVLLRTSFQTGMGCIKLPFLSTAQYVTQRGFLGVGYGIHVPIPAPGGEVDIGIEGDHTFINEDYTSMCGVNANDFGRFPDSTFALRPSFSYRLSVIEEPGVMDLEVSGALGYGLRQIFYTRTTVLNRGPVAGIMIDGSFHSFPKVRPVISGFFWAMQPLTSAGAASSESAFTKIDGTQCAKREFASAGNYSRFEFGGSGGVALGDGKRNSVVISAGISLIQTRYAALFVEDLFESADCSKKPDGYAARRYVPSIENEMQIFLSVRGEPWD